MDVNESVECADVGFECRTNGDITCMAPIWLYFCRESVLAFTSFQILSLNIYCWFITIS